MKQGDKVWIVEDGRVGRVKLVGDNWGKRKHLFLGSKRFRVYLKKSDALERIAWDSNIECDRVVKRNKKAWDAWRKQNLREQKENR